MFHFGQTIKVAHHKGRKHEGQVDNHVPHQLIVRDVFRIHKHPQQVNREIATMEAATLFFSEVASILPSQLSFLYPR